MRYLSGHTAHADRALRCAVAVALVAALVSMAAPVSRAHADSAAVYSCTVVPCYRHPVTGVIEDVGGEVGYATGLGMVQSCIFSEGMMEVTDAGAYYLTIRLGLLDYSSGHVFQVQEWGASDWSEPRLGVTNTGEDSNGATEDVCIEVPSQKCVVRITMYVEPMGRDVVCYCYPKDFTAGQPATMNATMAASAAGEAASAPDTGADAVEGAASDEAGEAGQGTSLPADTPDVQAPVQAGGAAAPETGEATDLESVDDSAVGDTAEEDLTGQSVSQAQGLSLSTAPAVGAVVSDGTFQLEVPEHILTALVAAASAACVFAAGAAVLLVALRRRLAAADPDDYSSLYGGDYE